MRGPPNRDRLIFVPGELLPAGRPKMDTDRKDSPEWGKNRKADSKARKTTIRRKALAFARDNG